MKYVCRQGGNNCDVSKTAQFMCRSCRLGKCISVGMSFAWFEGGLRKLNENRAATSQCIDLHLPETKRLSSASKQSNQPICEEAYDPAKIEMPLLQRMKRSYRVMCSVRRTIEFSHKSSPASCNTSFTSQNTSIHFTPITFHKMNVANRVSIAALTELAETVFDGFGDLSAQDRLNIIREGSAPIFICEQVLRTMKEFPNDDNILIVSYTHYVRSGELDDFFATPPSSECRIEAEKLMDEWMAGVRRLIRPLVIDAAMEETEFLAFIGLAFWCLASSSRGLSDGACAMAEEMRGRLFRELHIFYRNHRRLNNYADRLGKIMFLLTTCQEFFAHQHGQAELYRLVDLVTDESFWYQFHKQ